MMKVEDGYNDSNQETDRKCGDGGLVHDVIDVFDH